jgi:hypothetical protein
VVAGTRRPWPAPGPAGKRCYSYGTHPSGDVDLGALLIERGLRHIARIAKTSRIPRVARSIEGKNSDPITLPGGLSHSGVQGPGSGRVVAAFRLEWPLRLSQEAPA